MKNLYLVYIVLNEDEYNHMTRTLNIEGEKINDDKYVTLYSFTSSKSLLNEFLRVRNKTNKYRVKKIKLKDMTDEDKDFLRSEDIKNLEMDLGEFTFDTFDKKKLKDSYVKIPTTKKEYAAIDEYLDDYTTEIFTSFISYRADPYLIKKKYASALDYISYSILYDMYHGGNIDLFDNDERKDRQELAEDTMNYGMTKTGNRLCTELAMISILIHEFSFAF